MDNTKIHGNVVNGSTKLNLVQNVLSCYMPYEDLSIIMFLERKLQYNSIYMIGYVHPNIIMKAL
jgi:hypothetical protein